MFKYNVFSPHNNTHYIVNVLASFYKTFSQPILTLSEGPVESTVEEGRYPRGCFVGPLIPIDFQSVWQNLCVKYTTSYSLLLGPLNITGDCWVYQSERGSIPLDLISCRRQRQHCWSGTKALVGMIKRTVTCSTWMLCCRLMWILH